MSAESGAPLERVLDAVRATAPATASPPAKAVDSRLPLSARAKGRPRSASPSPRPPPADGALDLPAVPATARDSRAASPEPERPPAAPAPAPFAPGTKLEAGLAALQQLLEAGPEEADAILAHVPAPGGLEHVEGAGAGAAAEDTGPASRLLENPAYRASEGGEGLGSLCLQLLSLLDQRCAAAEARCAAVVATRAELSAAFAAEVRRLAAAAAGPREDVAALARGLEARLAALEARVDAGLREAAADSRAQALALEAKLEAQRRAGEEAAARVNQALLAIARKVGGLAAAAGQQ